MHGSTLAIIAAVFVGYAAISRRAEGTSLTAPIVFVVTGFLLGPEVFGWLDVDLGQQGISLLAEATLAVVLFSDASRIDLRALRQQYSVPARLLGIGLPLTIVAGTVVGALTLSTVTVAEALVLAIVLAPTDAALGQAVVMDPSVPSRIRQGLNVESGLNDGLCVPLLTIALAVAETEADATSGSHALRLVVEAIGWGIVGGVVAGGVAALVLRATRAKGWMAGHWAQVVPVAAAAGSYALADERGGSGFIAAFVGGVVFGIVSRRDTEETADFAEETGSVLNGLTLLMFGAVVLGSRWSSLGWIDVLYAVCSLTIVRMIPVAIAMIGSGARRPTVLFLGWFGPRGLASIVFGVIVIEASGLPHIDALIDPLVVTVALSVVAHGVSAAPLVRRYARWYATTPRAMESEPVAHQRWRHHRRRTAGSH